MEIRGAAGGDEAALFAGDLFNMYQNMQNHKAGKQKSWKQASRVLADTKK